MSILKRVKRLELGVNMYLENIGGNNIVQVFIEDDGSSFIPIIYHNYVTNEEIHGMYDKIRACNNVDELRAAIVGCGSNIPREVVQL